jgi:hypothetical protein
VGDLVTAGLAQVGLLGDVHDACPHAGIIKPPSMPLGETKEDLTSEPGSKSGEPILHSVAPSLADAKNASMPKGTTTTKPVRIRRMELIYHRYLPYSALLIHSKVQVETYGINYARSFLDRGARVIARVRPFHIFKGKLHTLFECLLQVHTRLFLSA